jgi:hypothetical protein
MKKGLIALLVILFLLGIIIFGYVMTGISYKNDEVGLRNQIIAQQKANENIYDKTWKTISQKAQISDKYKADFKDVYATIMNERYEGEEKGSPLFKFIKEHNPQFSVELYKDLGDAIESNRAEFMIAQNRLIDISREHNNLLGKFPGSWFLSGIQKVEIKIVTSTKTEKAFSTGKDDDVDLFK